MLPADAMAHDAPRSPQLLCEYETHTQYARHAALLASEGWRPREVVERPRRGLAGALYALRRGRLPAQAGADLLVTYTTG
jgi:hypothetical protein